MKYIPGIGIPQTLTELDLMKKEIHRKKMFGQWNVIIKR